MKSKIVLILAVFLLSFISVNAQQKPGYNYKAQKNFIPKDLGKIYLGMPFDEFAKHIDLSKATIGDTRFDWFELRIPFQKGDVTGLAVRIHGLSQDDKKVLVKRETIMKKDDLGYEYEDKVVSLALDKITSKGFVYSMYIDFKKDFDQKSYVLKTYGKDGQVREVDGPYRFYDIEWAKKTSDGLEWMIRSFHEGDDRSLKLLGVIEGTEWGNSK